MTFDPQRPLPGAPDPWASSSMPDRRAGPPYLMTEMIAAEPALAERLIRRLHDDPAVAELTQAVRDAAQAGQPVTVTGCGTSEYAAMVVARLLQSALRQSGVAHPQVRAAQALELAWEPMQPSVLIGVSHEGGTWATNLAMEAGVAAGSRIGLISVSDRSPGAAVADIVVATGEQDMSWCHTVGYLSPIVAAVAMAGRLAGREVDPVVVRALLDGADDQPSAEAAAGVLAGCSRLMVVGSGLDYPAARELALKVEEAAHLPAVAFELETIRHGHLAAADARTGLVMVLTDAEEVGTARLERSRAVLRSARELEMPTIGLLAADLGDDVPSHLTHAGRIAIPMTARLSRRASAALGAAIPLQLLAERLARARGTNPDTIGRDDPRQAAAAEA